jgi:hypothetical protein
MYICYNELFIFKKTKIIDKLYIGSAKSYSQLQVSRMNKLCVLAAIIAADIIFCFKSCQWVLKTQVRLQVDKRKCSERSLRI